MLEFGMKTSAKVLLASSVALGLATAAVLYFRRHHQASSPERVAWRDRAIEVIAARTADPDWLKSARGEIRVQSAKIEEGPELWLTDSIIVMSNGDWLAYTNICKKSDPRIADLFIARGSDGKWYYSTFHFCIEMVGLKIMQDTAPGSLAEFSNAYRLYPFEKGTDECLRQTWPKRE